MLHLFRHFDDASSAHGGGLKTRVIVGAISVLTLTTSAAVVGTAEGAVVVSNDSSFAGPQIDADPGEQNVIELRQDGGLVIVRGNQLVAMPPCEGGGTEVRCVTQPARFGGSNVGVHLGDLDDSLVDETGFNVFADLGEGNDVAVGGPGLLYVEGGDGDDVIGRGPLGTLPFSASGGAGNDNVLGFRATGGPGDDVVTGSTASGDEGNDRVTGAGRVNLIKGGPDDDVLLGTNSRTRKRGVRFNDFMLGGPGQDVLHGGGGPDYLHGAAGVDQCIGKGPKERRGRGPGDSAYQCESVKGAAKVARKVRLPKFF